MSSSVCRQGGGPPDGVPLPTSVFAARKHEKLLARGRPYPRSRRSWRAEPWATPKPHSGQAQLRFAEESGLHPDTDVKPQPAPSKLSKVVPCGTAIDRIRTRSSDVQFRTSSSTAFAAYLVWAKDSPGNNASSTVPELMSGS